ncbi:hypothetical protein [Cognataquiflexum rubidum]|uniref:hypothetical protein n=1 Tax=Cognataquiflexum rubidum TaxID=2922273 RepID=UPI001F129CE8|nr:hypothetical protein [Cognataquiflexum rubidum]MCH6235740.1 hypothetical protein [Cognataquiflexum rubidum]
MRPSPPFLSEKGEFFVKSHVCTQLWQWIVYPLVDLQCNQNPDYHKEDFPYSIDQILGDPVLEDEFLADFAEEFFPFIF